MRWLPVIVAVLVGTGACRREAERNPVQRFTPRALGVDFDAMPKEAAARQAAATAEARQAEALLGRGEVVLAAARLRRAVDLRPGDVTLRLRLAGAFERLDDPDAALRIIREAHRIRPTDPAILYQLGKVLFFGVKTTDPQELAEAVSAWNKLLEVAPGTSDASHARKHLPEVRAALQRARSAAHPDGGTKGSLSPPSTP